MCLLSVMIQGSHSTWPMCGRSYQYVPAAYCAQWEFQIIKSESQCSSYLRTPGEFLPQSMTWASSKHLRAIALLTTGWIRINRRKWVKLKVLEVMAEKKDSGTENTHMIFMWYIYTHTHIHLYQAGTILHLYCLRNISLTLGQKIYN